MLKKPTIAASAKTFRSRSRRAKSIDIETPVGPDSAKREYAVERRFLETPVLELSYYVDVVGVVPAEQHPVNSEDFDVGNGDASPEWGLDLIVNGGFLRYGPWADRQRRVPLPSPVDHILIGDGCIGPNCSVYSSPQPTRRQIRPIVSALTTIAFGQLCECCSSSAVGRRYIYRSAKHQRYFIIGAMS